MIIDAFILFNEIQMLDLRLHELSEDCDYFVLVEAAQTFAGRPKSYCFLENKEIFSKFLHKIIYFQVPRLPPLQEDTEEQRFRLETFQRDRIFDAVTHVPGISDEDIILISDVDEIPSRSAIRRVGDALLDSELVSFKQDHFRRKLNSEGLVKDEWALWPGTCAVKYKTFSRFMPGALRSQSRIDRFDLHSENRLLKLDVLDGGGWHLSYFGDARSLSWKVASFSHGASDSAVKYSNDAVEATQNINNEFADDDEIVRFYEIIQKLNYNVPISILRHPQKYSRLIV